MFSDDYAMLYMFNHLMISLDMLYVRIDGIAMLDIYSQFIYSYLHLMNHHTIRSILHLLVVAVAIAACSAFAPSVARSSSSNTLIMAAERSKSLPFLVKPAKVCF